MNVVLAILTLVACSVQSLRWLRIAQREHYLPSVGSFALRWWRSTLQNRLLGAFGVVAVAVSFVASIGLVLVAVLVVVAPIGLSLTGRTAPLAWTPRLQASAGTTAALTIGLVAAAYLFDVPGGFGLVMLAFPVLVDVGLVVWNPIQRRLDQQWVEQAKDGLARSGARVVAITGSYGKTTTKGYLAHMLATRTTVTASPASFNNRMGLARAVNEHLGAGTDVFIAEMGTYGPGEIRDLCSWIPPQVAVLTALGPVHLERMKTLEAIAAAKREIFERSSVGVILIDDPRLAAIATEEALNRRMVTVSTVGQAADVHGDPGSGRITVEGNLIGQVDPNRIQIGNAACAVGAFIALGFDPAGLEESLASLPTPPHRQVATTSERGFVVIDDTFNSNPAGAERGVKLLAEAAGGRRVVVTPGMVELGSMQARANTEFARNAAAVADDIVIVGRTNRGALEAGVREAGGPDGGGASVHFFDTREDAVVWVRETLGVGDAVLYENDLPDHYP